jgi:hypothetical protein
VNNVPTGSDALNRMVRSFRKPGGVDSDVREAFALFGRRQPANHRTPKVSNASRAPNPLEWRSRPCSPSTPSRFDRGKRGLLPASLAPRIPDTPCGMDQKMTALERAFQLARSGRVAGLTEIVTSLNREGYSANQIEGRLLKRQLADLIKVARKASVDSTPT